MSLREIPVHFTCDRCQHAQHVDFLCWETHRENTGLCLHCCGCATHRADDPGGRVVFDRHGWRGLDDNDSRTRRHA
jgi:hypothetical protein